MGENTVEITDSNFESEVVKSTTPVLVDFWAAWCAPCRALAPTVDSIAAEYKGRVKVGKLDVDANGATAARFNIRGIPTLLVIKDGQVKEQIVGAVDEGKGKIVDILSQSYDCVARYQGGHNAGHTVNIGDRHHVLHLIPSGIFHRDVKCVIGGGVVLDPLALIEESEAIERSMSIPLAGRLFVSNRCHLILPYHRALESAIENQLGERRIGTTSRGIGPAYEDKMGRRGLRVCDLIDSETLPDKIRALVL